jgi:hypothetical protein
MPRPRKKRRGRPLAPFRTDQDRHAVALSEMMLGTTINGHALTVRNASCRAAIAKEGHLHSDVTVSEAPEGRLAATGRRHSPVKPIFKQGYRERIFGHVERHPGGHVLDNCAQRLWRKRREWLRHETKKAWVRAMAQAWAAAMYPHAIRRDQLQDPATVCAHVAMAAGEEQFLYSKLLPCLRANEASDENQMLCQNVICSIF